MALRYKQVMQALNAYHSVPPDEASAFAGRVKHLQRLKFPPGVNVGPGAPANYGVDQVMMLVIATDLMRHGLKPTVAIHLVLRGWEHLKPYLQRWAAHEDQDVLIVFRMSAFASGDLDVVDRFQPGHGNDHFSTTSKASLLEKMQKSGPAGYAMLHGNTFLAGAEIVHRFFVALGMAVDWKISKSLRSELAGEAAS